MDRIGAKHNGFPVHSDCRRGGAVRRVGCVGGLQLRLIQHMTGQAERSAVIQGLQLQEDGLLRPVDGKHNKLLCLLAVDHQVIHGVTERMATPSPKAEASCRG